jgi:cell wall-associated NlpC family hydrolase
MSQERSSVWTVFAIGRPIWGWWGASLAGWLCVSAWPVSSGITRLASLAAFSSVLVLLSVATWRRVWVRTMLLALIVTSAGFLIWASGHRPSPELLRQDFTAALRRYEGVHYIWGGENFIGIDCSGLVRRGWIDALFVHGLCTLNSGLVRSSARFWWHDFSASDLANHQKGLTIPVLAAANLNGLDHGRIAPGDLAVTGGGEHVMAYLGDMLWIEADPLVGRVIVVKAPCSTNAWFQQQVKIVRLRSLAG